MKKYRVIFHLDEEDSFRVNLVLKNIQNLLMDIHKENIEIELLANAAGVKIFLINSNYLKSINELFQQGVKFAACSNAIKGLNIDREKMTDNVKIVSSGMGELVKKQSEGWLYIKP